MIQTRNSGASRVVSFRIKGEVENCLEQLEAKKHLKRSDLLREIFERGLMTYGKTRDREISRLRCV